MSAARARPLFPIGVAVFAFVFLGLFMLYPLWNVFKASVFDSTGTTLTLANYIKVLSTAFYRAGLYNSLLIGVLTTLASIAIGVPLAFCVARLPVPGKPILLALAALPLVLPSFVGAYAWVLLLGRQGIFSQFLASIGLPGVSIYGVGGLVLVFTLHTFPYVMLPALAAFKAIDVSIEEAGQNLGASRLQTFWRVTFPVVMPAVLAGGLLVFMETTISFVFVS